VTIDQRPPPPRDRGARDCATTPEGAAAGTHCEEFTDFERRQRRKDRAACVDPQCSSCRALASELDHVKAAYEDLAAALKLSDHRLIDASGRRSDLKNRGHR
jgi:hypothetical protein